MKTRPTLVICLILVLLNSSSAAYDQQETVQQELSATAHLTNKDVLEMLKIGLSPEIVAAKIMSANCSFDTSVMELKNLKAAGVPNPVLLTMVQAPSAQDAAKPPSSTQLRDYVPLLQSLPWPIVVFVVLIIWGSSFSRLLAALVNRVESGAKIEAGGVILYEPPSETYEPYPY